MPQHITVFAPENTDLWNRFWIDGDVSALFVLFEKNNPEFSATCYGFLNQDRALEPKDVIADQIIKFIEYRKNGKDYSHRKNPRSFIKVCLSNSCKSYLRKKRIKTESPEKWDQCKMHGTDSKEYESRELMEYLQTVIRGIEDTDTKQCRVFVNYLMDVPVKEIAVKLRVEESYVYDSISKIRKKTFYHLVADVRGRDLVDMYPVFFQKYFKNEYK